MSRLPFARLAFTVRPSTPLLSVILGLLLLFMVRFNGLWFLWPLSILAAGVVGFGVLMAHSAVTRARESLNQSHPLRRFRVAQEIAFWLILACGALRRLSDLDLQIRCRRQRSRDSISFFSR